jgi:poly-beta-1,6-N-acetyl-D-glucosamine synthase
MVLAFWLALAFIAYTYVGYPLLITLIAQFRRPVPVAPLADWPSVCVLVAVHNEASRIPAKIENLRSLSYPREKIRLLFVSDGSTDGTVSSLEEAGVECIVVPDRRGKAHALNTGAATIHEEVVLLTDVRQTVEPAALEHLVKALLQPGVGAVSGELMHRDPATKEAANIGLYWKYEKLLRRAESRVHSTAGATGALYAIRREDLITLPEDTLLDDFEIPIARVRKGYRVLFEPKAIIYDELQQRSGGERRRKIRTLAGNFQSFGRNPWLFVPWLNPICWQFLSHKVFRLLVPYALLVLLATSLLLEGWYRAFGVVQLIGYSLAGLGMVSAQVRRLPLVSFGVVFVDLNLAALMALREYAMGRINARWEKT